MTEQQLPEALAQIRDDFLALEQRERLQLLLEFSNALPELPERYADHPDLLERVEECQSSLSTSCSGSMCTARKSKSLAGVARPYATEPTTPLSRKFMPSPAAAA